MLSNLYSARWPDLVSSPPNRAALVDCPSYAWLAGQPCTWHSPHAADRSDTHRLNPTLSLMMLKSALTTTNNLYARWRSRLRPGIIGSTVESTPLSQQITRWLGDWRQGDDAARDRLFAVVQPQLQQIAARFLHHERADHTLRPNALVNDSACACWVRSPSPSLTAPISLPSPHRR